MASFVQETRTKHLCTVYQKISSFRRIAIATAWIRFAASSFRLIAVVCTSTVRWDMQSAAPIALEVPP
jgi:hypothetical protein